MMHSFLFNQVFLLKTESRHRRHMILENFFITGFPICLRQKFSIFNFPMSSLLAISVLSSSKSDVYGSVSRLSFSRGIYCLSSKSDLTEMNALFKNKTFRLQITFYIKNSYLILFSCSELIFYSFYSRFLFTSSTSTSTSTTNLNPPFIHVKTQAL